MASNRKAAAEAQTFNGCDLCKGIKTRQGRNAGIVHILKFTDPDELAAHLKASFSTPYCVEFHTDFWFGVHQRYSHIARDKYAPLWLVYLEANGVTVHHRAESIMRHRGRMPRQQNEAIEDWDSMIVGAEQSGAKESEGA